MFSQYRNKIIALFTTVCLLVTALCVPVSAADEPATMLYNGVELPNIDSVWTDKVTYRYAFIVTNADVGTEVLLCTNEPYGGSVIRCSGAIRLYIYDDGSDSWQFEYELSSINVSTARGYSVVWTSVDILDSDGMVYLAGSAPVDPNAPMTPSGSIEVASSQVLDDSASFVLNLSDLTETGDVYSVKVSRFIGETLDGEFTSEPFSSSTGSLHLTAANLTPETEYRFVFSLLLNDEETGISSETTLTTLASATADDSVDETETLSLLSAIYAAIINQNDTHLSMYDSIGNMLGQIWLRLRYIEENILALAPSAEETALKTATAETTATYTEMLWGGESGDSVGKNSFSISTEAFTSSKNMLDTGVSVSDFFGMFGTYGWGNWFSAETRDDLDTVPSVSTVTADDELSTYEKNLKEIQSFIGGG